MLLSSSIDLSSVFQSAVQLMEDTNQNVFLTGKAGTGKSTLLSYFRKTTKKSTVVLAPTGVSALNVEGQTIHSFFGFKPNVTVDSAKKSARKTHQPELYSQLDMLIVDEISMVRADLLDCMDVFMQTVLHNKRPFGGKQVVFIGDLYQLSPVVSADEKLFFSEVYASPYFFSSTVMDRVDFDIQLIELDKIYRQTDDVFIDLLNGVRTNSITDEQLACLNARVFPNFESEQGYIHLTGTNMDADRINANELALLPASVFNSEGRVTGEFNPKHAPTETSLRLKIGAQVMFLNNDVQGRWVNGTIGQVTQLPGQSLAVTPSDDHNSEVQVEIPGKGLVSVSPYKWPMYRYAYDSVRRIMTQESAGTFTQYPLKLSWAITIHKSQGKTFDRVVLDLKRGTFAHGQSYVALSRCRSLEGLILKYPFRKSHIMMDSRVIEFLTRFCAGASANGGFLDNIQLAIE
jgi:ATP-dependent DNA helicase PIF1